MRVRLLGLLAVCAAAGIGAAYVGHIATGAAAAAPANLRPHAHLAPTQARVGRTCPLPRKYRTAFETASSDTGLPLALLVAVAQTESRFHANAVSHADARGLLQILPATAAALRLNINEPSANVLAGARYLRMLVDRFRSADLALAAYNAGPTAVTHAGGAPTLETQTYVADVNVRWQLLAACDGA